MRSRSAALLVVAACLALAAWMGFAWNRARHVAVRELEGASDFQPVARASQADATAVMAPSATESGTAAIATQRVDPSAETELNGTLRVVFDSDDRPAAGVDIYWFASLQLAEGRWRDDLDELGMGVDFFQRNGRHFVSDDSGAARIPTDSGRIQIVGTTRTHFGMATFTREAGSPEPIVLRLREAFALSVRVLHASSRSPARDVVVVASCSQLPGMRVGARSDEQGIARLFPLFHEDDPRGQWYASLPGVFFDEIRVALPMKGQSDPLELLLPESAPATVRIVDDKGELCPLSGKLLIGWNDRDGDPLEPRSVRISDGIANLTRLEVGVKLHVRAQIPELTDTPESVFTLGPKHAAVGRFELQLKNR